MRRHRRFVALQVDDDGFVVPVQQVGYLGDALRAGAVLVARHAYGSPEVPGSLADTFVVRRDHDVPRTALAPAVEDVFDHGFAVDLAQRLARQTR